MINNKVIFCTNFIFSNFYFIVFVKSYNILSGLEHNLAIRSL